jgi:hypothetical protein
MNGSTDFLFARPSFWEGAARIIDLGDTLTEYNSSLSGQQADRNALRADWRAIGHDLASVFYATIGGASLYRAFVRGAAHRASVATK